MRNARIAFEEYDSDMEVLAKKGYKELGMHLIFDIKMGENSIEKLD